MKLRNHVSASFLRKLKNSPRHAFMETVPTPAMEFGSAFHSWLLQPEQYLRTYHVLDDSDICNQIGGAKPRATSAYKSWIDSLPKDKKLIKIEEHQKLLAMSYNVRKIKFAKYLLQNCTEFEKEFNFELEVMDKSSPVKGYFDGISQTKNYIIEVKTCSNIDDFQKDCSKFSYNIQAAIYKKAAEKL